MGDERYESFTDAIEAPEPGKIVFADDGHRAHSRRWTNRQSAASAIGPSTTQALIVAESLHDNASTGIASPMATLRGSIPLVGGRDTGRHRVMSWKSILTTLVVIASPGTRAIYTLAAALRGGDRAGLVAAFGCTLGIVPHMVAAISGTAALFHPSDAAFAVLRVAGVGYLLSMPWTMLPRDAGDCVRRPRPSLRHL